MGLVRLFTLFIVFLNVGFPYIGSSSSKTLWDFFKERGGADNPLILIAWVLWGIWMVYPIFAWGYGMLRYQEYEDRINGL